MPWTDMFSPTATASGNSLSTTTNGLGAGVGLGFSILGTMEQSSALNSANAAQQQISGLEQQENQQRNVASNLAYDRQKSEVLRNNQVARSMAISSATNQGAQFSSGLSGGLGQISGQSGTNLLGINQNQEVTNQLFSLDTQVSQQKQAMADAQTKASTASGLAGLGGSISKSIGPLGQLLGSALPLLAL